MEKQGPPCQTLMTWMPAIEVAEEPRLYSGLSHAPYLQSYSFQVDIDKSNGWSVWKSGTVGCRRTLKSNEVCPLPGRKQEAGKSCLHQTWLTPSLYSAVHSSCRIFASRRLAGRQRASPQISRPWSLPQGMLLCRELVPLVSSWWPSTCQTPCCTTLSCPSTRNLDYFPQTQR